MKTFLELLAPARNADIGIAAIDSGADAVYIAGPQFGARKDAGNPIEEIARLCSYAHKFGARIFVTVNILLRDDEFEEVHRQMLAEQEAGVDAFIIRDMRICSWKDISVPLHASTQCAIRTVEDALRYEAAGCSRIVLERELSLSAVREICKAVACEVEFFVHGALCVCYSGECRLSEYIDGRSADRGECIQACRSMYDLVDGSGKLLLRNKALLSLKDFNLHDRIPELAAAGICSFKIEGRLKSISYVRNITRYHSMALDALVAAEPEKYARASFGRVYGGVEPDPWKTFNRGYTELFLDGKRGKWSSMDAPKSMGEFIGTVIRVRYRGKEMEIGLKPASKGLELHNGDGFAFAGKGGVIGFRGDLCSSNTIVCKAVEGVREGLSLYRNIDTQFEKELDKNPARRELSVALSVKVHGKWNIDVTASCEDGREFLSPFKADLERAENRERAEAMLREQLGKRSLHYNFHVESLVSEAPGGALPLLSASTINSIRRLIAEDLDSIPVKAIPMASAAGKAPSSTKKGPEGDSTASGQPKEPLMKSKYCIRYELGMCPVHQGAKESGPLYLLNNGRRLALHFDCKACEMTVTREQK
ncbi:MAG: U32 family peptidase [Bacteroidales bacterium]|nr:U32 family peptidase [Bacteroidales bacterium]